jgi:hypothetical protein
MNSSTHLKVFLSSAAVVACALVPGRAKAENGVTIAATLEFGDATLRNRNKYEWLQFGVQAALHF